MTPIMNNLLLLSQLMFLAYGRQRWVGVVCFRVFRLAFALQGSQRVPGVDVSGELTFTLAGPSDIDLTSH